MGPVAILSIDVVLVVVAAVVVVLASRRSTRTLPEWLRAAGQFLIYFGAARTCRTLSPTWAM